MKATARDQWLQERQKGLGGSDAAAAIGVSPYCSPAELWAQKTGLVEAPSLDDVEAVRWGLRLERPIAEEFAERTGRKVKLNPGFQMTWSESFPWMFATLDGTQQAKDRKGPGILQIKTTAVWNENEWAGGRSPLHYQIQLQHEMTAAKVAWGTLCCLIGGQQLVWVDSDWDQAFALELIEAERRFWDQVTRGVPPEPDASVATGQAYGQLWKRHSQDLVMLPATAEEWDRELVEAKAQKKALESRITELENQLKYAIRDALGGITPGGAIYTWQSQTTEHKAKAAYKSTFRVLRRKGESTR